MDQPCLGHVQIDSEGYVSLRRLAEDVMRTHFAEADATLARDDVTARATALAGDAYDDDRAMLAWLESDAGTTALEAELSTVQLTR